MPQATNQFRDTAGLGFRGRGLAAEVDDDTRMGSGHDGREALSGDLTAVGARAKALSAERTTAEARRDKALPGRLWKTARAAPGTDTTPFVEGEDATQLAAVDEGEPGPTPSEHIISLDSPQEFSLSYERILRADVLDSIRDAMRILNDSVKSPAAPAMAALLKRELESGFRTTALRADTRYLGQVISSLQNYFGRHWTELDNKQLAALDHVLRSLQEQKKAVNAKQARSVLKKIRSISASPLHFPPDEK